MSFPSGSETMPVILDNIQFYHGPSKPAKPPYFAFNSKKGSNSNTLLSGEQPAFSNEPVSSATDDSTMFPTGFLPPAANAEDATHQRAVGSPNLFDLELERPWAAATPLLSTREASDRDACPSLRALDCHCRDNSDETMHGDSPSSAANSSKSGESDRSDVFLRHQQSCTSPLQSPLSPSIAALSAMPHPEIMQSQAVEDVQWRGNQPSYPVYFESLSPARDRNMSDVSASFGEHSSNTSLSSISSCSDVALKKRKEMSSCIPSRKDCPDDYLDDNEEANQTRLISGCSPKFVTESGPSGPVDPLHVNMPDSMDLELVNGHESGNSHPGTPNVQGHQNLVLANPRKCKEKERPPSWTGKQHTTSNERHSSVAVVIPPPPPRPSRKARSKPKPVPLKEYESESSDHFDDSSDEDFMSSAIQSELSDIEDSLEGKHGPPSRTAPCYPDNTRFGSSTTHYQSRDIVGRAILTIETQGSEPTFFFTLVPDNVPSISYIAAHSPPHNSEKVGGVLSPPKSVSRSTRGKSKRWEYSTDEDNLLVKLKEERKLTWKEITDYFPGRKSSSLQVHYSTKLKHRRAGVGRPRGRRGRKK